MAPLRFGIIGVGNVAPIHALAIRGTPDAELVAVATRNPGRGRAFVAEYGGTWCSDYRDLLAREDVDIVTLCTPHDLHAPMTLDCAAAHKHVLCEKPMARTVAECDAMIAACEQSGVALSIIFQSRFEPLALKLKAALDAGRLGRLLWVSANTMWHRTDEYYLSGPWRGTWEHEGGGVLVNQAVHDIDMLIWLAGTPARVTAQTRTLSHQIEVEDCALAILEYADGRLGLIQATTCAFPGYPERLEFYGQRGSAVYHKGEGKLEWHLLEPHEDLVEETGGIGGAAQPMDMNAAGHTIQFQEFAGAVRDRRTPAVDGREGRRSVELFQAIFRSACENKAVALPL